MIREIEAAIVARIAARLPDLHVAAFPDKPENFNMHHPAGAVLTAFGRETYSRPRAIDVIVQERRIEWDVSVLTRNLRTHAGAYAVLDALRLALTGWRPAGSGKLWPVRAEFLDHKQGLWTYMLVLEHAVTVAECGEEEADCDLPPLTGIDLRDEFGGARTPRSGFGAEEAP